MKKYLYPKHLDKESNMIINDCFVRFQRMMRRVAAAAGIFTLLVASAQAQYNVTNPQFNSLYASHTNYMMNRMAQQTAWTATRTSISAQSAKRVGQPAAAARAAPIVPAKPAYAKPLTVTDFTPVGLRNVPEQLAAQPANAKDRQQLSTAGRDILKTIEATPGFRKNNLAAAMTVLLGVALQVHYGIQIPDAESQNLMREINDVVATLDAFTNMPADKRTLAYDTFIVIGGFIAGIAQEGAESKNAELTQQAKAMARDALSQFGM